MITSYAFGYVAIVLGMNLVITTILGCILGLLWPWPTISSKS